MNEQPKTETRLVQGGGYEGYVSWDGERFYITAAKEGSPIAAFLDALADAAAECVKARAAPVEERPLFQSGDFTLHSGQQTSWKIECDALTDGDIETLAAMIVQRFYPFDRCEWVETGGRRLGKLLQGFVSPKASRLLIVDDVLTTGASMEAQRAGRDAIGVVVFARGPCPSWVTPLFTVPVEDRLREAAEFAVKQLDNYFHGGSMDTVELHAVMETIRNALAGPNQEEAR